MNDATIYHNPRCSTSRKTLDLLRDNGIEPTVVQYLKTPPSRAQLVEMINDAGIAFTAGPLNAGDSDCRMFLPINPVSTGSLMPPPPPAASRRRERARRCYHVFCREANL